MTLRAAESSFEKWFVREICCRRQRKFAQKLLLAEAFGLFDGEGEFFDELLVRLVRREVEPVEAGVGPRKPRLLSDLLDAEPLRTVGAHQLGEAADGNAAGAADELQQPAPLLVVHRANKLQRQSGAKFYALSLFTSLPC